MRVFVCAVLLTAAAWGQNQSVCIGRSCGSVPSPDITAAAGEIASAPARAENAYQNAQESAARTRLLNQQADLLEQQKKSLKTDAQHKIDLLQKENADLKDQISTLKQLVQSLQNQVELLKK